MKGFLNTPTPWFFAVYGDLSKTTQVVKNELSHGQPPINLQDLRVYKGVPQPRCSPSPDYIRPPLRKPKVFHWPRPPWDGNPPHPNEHRGAEAWTRVDGGRSWSHNIPWEGGCIYLHVLLKHMAKVGTIYIYIPIHVDKKSFCMDI